MSVCAWTLCAVLLPILPGQPARDKAITEELRRLQGTWKFESLEQDGKPVAVDQLKDRTFFFGADVFLIRRDTALVQLGALQINPTKEPRTINAMVKLGDRKGTVMLGIYALSNDTLKVCFDMEGQERPKEFKTAPDSNLMFGVCKRVKPKDEQIEITGTYKSECFQEDGTKFVSEATIERRGDSYLVTYKKGPLVAYVGVGVRQGDIFSMSWINQGQVGITTYRIEAGPRLVGQYTHLGGVGIVNREVLTAQKKLLDVRLR